MTGFGAITAGPSAGNLHRGASDALSGPAGQADCGAQKADDKHGDDRVLERTDAVVCERGTRQQERREEQRSWKDERPDPHSRILDLGDQRRQEAYEHQSAATRRTTSRTRSSEVRLTHSTAA